MRAHLVVAPVMVLGLAIGCGGNSTTAPSTVTPSPAVSPAAAQGIVGATVTQATGMLVSAAPGGLSRVMTQPCPAGGSMTMIFSVTTPAVPSGPMSTSSRMEFSDCRSQTVTINGDPYLAMTAEHSFGPVVGSGPSSLNSIIRMTGGLRFDAGGMQGRAQYDCTQTVTMQIDSNGTPSPPSITSTGTVTWEQPLGTVTVRPCGP